MVRIEVTDSIRKQELITGQLSKDDTACNSSRLDDKGLEQIKTNATSLQREHHLRPSSIVSMDSINIEENLATMNGIDLDKTT